MNGSKPTSPAYCCWRLGGRFKKGIAAEYLERGGAVVFLVLPVEGDDTMATSGDVDASVMLSVAFMLLCYYYSSFHKYVVCSLFFAKGKSIPKHWWLVISCFVRFEGQTEG